MESKSSSDKRFALLIDADNVSAKYLKPMLNELSKYGTVTIKRIYGDWTLTLHAKWKDALLENSITPIQQFGYTQGKNATDSAMIIDAMDILYTDKVEGFCIVSSDSDFTRLASRLRESGRMVIGMGEKKTPTPFRRACDVFTTLELLVDQNKRDKGGNGAPSMSKAELEQAVVDIITDNQNNGKATGLGEVGSRLLKRYPDFDVRSYGTNLLSKLLSEFTRIKITRDHSSVTVELADAEAKDAKQKEKAEGETAATKQKAAEKPEAAADAADEVREDAAEAEQTDASADEKPRKRRARRSHRSSSGRSARQAATEEAQPEADAGDESENPSEDAAASGSDAPTATADAARPAADSAARNDETSTADEAPQDGAESAETEQAAAPSEEEAPKKSRSRGSRRRGGRRKSATAAEQADSTDAPMPEQSAEVPGATASDAEPAATDDADANNASEPAKPARKRRTRSGGKKAAASTADNAPASEPALAAPEHTAEPVAAAAAPAPAAPSDDETPQRFIFRTVSEAGGAGIPLTEIGQQLRARFKNFKVRDLGYPQLRQYVSNTGDFTLAKEGKDLIVRLAE